ncbi:leucyl/phenylalanyl-tRNA--protein transferase [Methylobacterium aerolatum]|uniref:Leucyl/phenylalanyl-tRNA--protein transferase n=1 Tax=Methylobacterium aerolatum TaxID=418708 RepID=A0ABU0HZY7_9HYPH|nr:leucyl/phenylalanyl-tRNA--protein transferase [Methylobacterium aerolatum]MDQ0447029.1 leucyl/phenylalanyl-tRNA--protein transferase [Methylobacterium aerolatum]GJD36818.1 Leucyl/phenylalanyl-tRNA--protein transferase [Methylobacterium aerolatum]
MQDGARIDITPEILLKAYAAGIFPMAEDADDPTLYWVEPRARGILPLDGFRVPRRLARTVRSDQFEVCCDTDFDAVIDGCAGPRRDSERTWINERIRELYGALFDRGYVHTVEVFSREPRRLVGGLYGVSLGAAFFGESMFHSARDASKVALVHLMARLRTGGYRLADTQFVTDHLSQFGAEEIPRHAYKRRLAAALEDEADWGVWPGDGSVTGEQVLLALTGGE